jgi:drug/metabolite transporter (DMT)-like permease
VQTLFGLLAASAFTAGEQALGATPIRWSPGVVAALLYVSLGASVVAYRCWGLGVAEGGPALAAFFNNLTPLFAALLSTCCWARRRSPITPWRLPSSWPASWCRPGGVRRSRQNVPG